MTELFPILRRTRIVTVTVRSLDDAVTTMNHEFRPLVATDPASVINRFLLVIENS